MSICLRALLLFLSVPHKCGRIIFIDHTPHAVFCFPISLPLTPPKQTARLCTRCFRRNMWQQRKQRVNQFSWLWSSKSFGFTGTKKTPGIARDLDKTSFVRAWLSTCKKNNSSSKTQINKLIPYPGDLGCWMVERRVRGEAMVVQISIVSETRSLWTIFPSHIPEKSSKPP